MKPAAVCRFFLSAAAAGQVFNDVVYEARIVFFVRSVTSGEFTVLSVCRGLSSNIKKNLAFSALFIIAAAFLQSPGSAFARTDPGTISGAIFDSAGSVVPDAVIEAKNMETGALFRTASTQIGDFILEQLPPGEYELKALMPGFKRFVQRGLDVRPGQTLHFNVQLEIESISHTIRVSESSPQRLMVFPQVEPEAMQISVSEINAVQIERQGAKNIVEALNYVPGAWVESRGRKVKQFVSTRGQKYPYPEYSIDGALFREFHEVPYFLSAADIEKIEILRSSASLLSGFTGLAGVINVVPRTYETRETSWLAEYGSLNSYRVHASHGQKIGKVSFGLGLDGSHTDGPEDRRGAENMLNLFGDMSAQLHPTLSVRATAFHLQGSRELVQAVPPAAARFRDELGRFDPIQTTIVTVKSLYQPKSWTSTQFTLGYSNRHNTYVDSSGGTTHDYDSEWNLNLVQAFSISESNVLRAGANYNHWVAPYGKRFFSGRRSDLETVSVSILDEHSFGRLVLDGGMRYQRTYINEYGAFNIDGSAGGLGKVTPIKDMWEPAQLSGSLGATYFLTNRVSLRGNFLAGAIEPRRGTLTVDMKEPATEHRTMLDAGVQIVRDRIGEFSLVGFYIKQDDAIVLSGSTATLNGRIMELYKNQDQDAKGLEFDFRSRPFFQSNNLFFNITAMSSRARLEDGSMSRDPEKPRVLLGAGIMGKRWHLDYNFFWKFVSAYESSRFAADSAAHPLGDFHTLNLTLGHSFGHEENIRVYLEMINLADNRYSTVVGYPDYGRRFQLGIRHKF
jgi:outer membrane receptor protein involved in Fe transport